MAKAHVLLWPSAAVVVAVAVAVMSVVTAELAAVLVSGNGNGSAMGTLVGLPLLMAARGARVEDQEAAEMDSEAHRVVALTVHGTQGPKPLDPDRPACLGPCGAKGDRYVPVPRPCSKYYQCSNSPSP
jgi:hypothetical protein